MIFVITYLVVLGGILWGVYKVVKEFTNGGLSEKSDR